MIFGTRRFFTLYTQVPVNNVRVHLILDVEGDVFLGFERFIPEDSAAGVKSSGVEIAAT